MLNLRKALIFNPENGWAHYEMFTTFHRLKRLEECLPHAKRFLELVGFGVVATDVRRKLSEIELAIGEHYIRRSRWDAAAEHFRYVLTLEPTEQVAQEARKDLATAYRTLFYHLHGKQQYVAAANYLDLLMAMRPGDAEARKAFDIAYYNKVRRFAAPLLWEAIKILRKRADFDRALAYIGRLLESGPSTALRKKALEMKEEIAEEQVSNNSEGLGVEMARPGGVN